MEFKNRVKVTAGEPVLVTMKSSFMGLFNIWGLAKITDCLQMRFKCIILTKLKNILFQIYLKGAISQFGNISRSGHQNEVIGQVV